MQPGAYALQTAPVSYLCPQNLNTKLIFMKKLMLPLFAVLLFAACQNSSTPTVDNPASAAPVVAAPPVVESYLKFDPTQVKEATESVKISIQNMKDLIKDVNETAAAKTGSEKATLDGISRTLNDVLTKQEMVKETLETTDFKAGAKTSDSGEITPSDILIEALQSAASYDQISETSKAQLALIKSGKN